MSRLSRRQFLRDSILTAGAAALAAASSARPDGASAASRTGPEQLHKVYLPTINTHFLDVVQVHAPSATHWDFNPANPFYDHVNPAVVNQMVVRGLCDLTGTASAAAAWGRLLPDYQAGQKIAIKINLNNSVYTDDKNYIDAIADPVNALIASLIAAGIPQDAIMVYDAVRPMLARFYNRRAYTQVLYYDNGNGLAGNRATFNHAAANLKVAFTHPNLSGERWLTDILSQATYLINLPILKRHGLHPVTLGFKNHFGSLNTLGVLTTNLDNPHIYINPADAGYTPNYSPLVDLNANLNIAAKTVLTLADGLFGASSVTAVPARWQTFGNQSPNSLLFSRDPVAMDCVLCDLLRAEFGLSEIAYDYLKLAETRGLGRFERGDPWGAGYHKLAVLKVEM